MTELTLTTTENHQLDAADLALLGEGEIAYVRPIRSDDVQRLFPGAPTLQPGLDLFALLSASGAPIMLADTRDAVLVNATRNELHAVSLH